MESLGHLSEARIEEIIEGLRRRGLKVTSQRLAVIRALLNLRDKHPTMTMIHKEAMKMAPTISFSTVYTTLKTLESLGMIKLFSHHGDTVVEVNVDPHINVIRDEEIIDVYDPELVEEIRKRLNKHGIDADKIIVNVLVA
jgi:Fe2+ or Zn2+ uptake regulation protein